MTRAGFVESNRWLKERQKRRQEELQEREDSRATLVLGE